MAADQGGVESQGVRSLRAEERHLETARELGEHNARIAQLERRFDRDVTEIRSTLQRLEAQRAMAPPAVAQPDPNLMLATQSLNRVADALAKPPPASPPASATNPVAVIGYVIGSMALAWAARGFIPGV